MAGGINIKFLSDVTPFLRGTGDITSALDKVSGSLDDLTQEAQSAGEGFGDGIKDGAKQAEAAVDGLGKAIGSEIESGADKAESAVDGLGEKIESSLDSADEQAETAGKAIGSEIESGADKAEDSVKTLERKFRDVFDGVGDTTRKAGDDIGSNIRRGTDEASAGMSNFKEEASQTARETAASFDGTADSAVDMVQETLANALGGFGPLGAAAGLALAAAAGAMWTAWQDKTELAKQAVADMYDDMIASGQGFLSAQFINDEIAKIGRGEGSGAIKDMDTAMRLAKASGADLSDVLRAVAGDTDAAARVQEALNTRYAELGPNAGSAILDVNQLQEALTATANSSDTAAARASAVREAMLATGEASREYAQAVAGIDDAMADFSESLTANNEAWAGNAEQLRTENIGALSELADELDGVNVAAVAAGVSGDELAAVQAENVAQFLAAAEAAGFTAEEATNLARQYGLIPSEVSTTVTGDTTPALDALAALGISIDTTTGTVTMAGNPVPAETTLGQLLGNVDAATGTVQIGGNSAPASLTVGELLGWIAQQGSSVTASANTADAERDINQAARDRTATIYTRMVKSDGGTFASGGFVDRYAAGGPVQRFPGGGLVDGPGGPLDDRVPAALSPGEFVLDAQSVQQIGPGRLEQLNNGQLGAQSRAGSGVDMMALADAVTAGVAAALDGATLHLGRIDPITGAVKAQLRLEQQRRAGI